MEMERTRGFVRPDRAAVTCIAELYVPGDRFELSIYSNGLLSSQLVIIQLVGHCTKLLFGIACFVFP